MSNLVLHYSGSRKVSIVSDGETDLGDGFEVCCWNVSSKFSHQHSIEVNSVLNFLTSMEAESALIDWHNALEINGVLKLDVLDMDFYIDLWMKAKWDEKNIKNSESDARRSFSHIFGPQSCGNPKLSNYSSDCDDVYKSGYNLRRLEFILKRVGFSNVMVKSDSGVLSATAEKKMNRGERQIAESLESIRKDHLNRYQFATEQLQVIKPSRILDLACGIGYGTKLLSEKLVCSVVGVDIDENAISHARNFFNDENTSFICEDARKLDSENSAFDAIVSFETIEHIDFDEELVKKFYHLLKSGGLFICSTPNQDIMPFDKEKFSYHLKHYTNSELLSLLNKAGFSKVELYAQYDPVNGEVIKGSDGCFTIAVCEK